MKAPFAAVVAASLLASALGAQDSAPATRSGTRLVPRELEVGGLERSYLLYVPPIASPDLALPLVMSFHGGGGRARQMELLTGFCALAKTERFIVAYPDGINRGWNDGRVAVDIALRRDVDDVAFASAVIDDVARQHPVDRKRVYATGISSGAIFCHYLAARLPDRIAAIAPVVGGIAIPFNREFHPASPVSVLVIQGTADPLVPYAGGGIAGGGGRGRIIGTEEAVKLWVAADECSGPAVSSTLPDQAPGDGCTATRSAWGGGKSGSAVELVKIDGGGHTWPGGPQYLPIAIVGRVCRDFDAKKLIWGFFKAHPKA